MNGLKRLVWLLRQRWGSQARISFGAYIKGEAKIQVGKKAKIHRDVSLDASRQGRIVIGDGVTLNRYAFIQGDAGGVVLGDRVEVNNYTIINGTGGVESGADTLIGPGARLISYQHQIEPNIAIRRQSTVAKSIRVGQGAWVGANAVILAGVSVGDGAVIGAGAVVTQDVPANAIVVGVPARILRYR